MAIYNRCPKCRTLNILKNLACSKCLHSMKGVKSYYVRLMVNGKSISKLAGKTLTEAKMIEAKIKSGYIPNAESDSIEKISLNNFINKIFKIHYESKNKEIRRAFSKINIINEHFKGKLLSEISAFDIEKFYQYRMKINSTATANQYLAIVKRIFNYAVEIEYLKTSPVRSKTVHCDNKRIRFLTSEEKERLLDASLESKNKNLYAIILTALDTGMRRGEIAAIQKEDINAGILTIKGSNAKSKKSRHIPLTKRLQGIFENIDNIKFDVDIKNAFHYAMRKAGINDFRFHDLRHTFASDLVMKGVDLYTVSKLLGHSTIEMTQRYAHLAPSVLKNAIEKLESK